MACPACHFTGGSLSSFGLSSWRRGFLGLIRPASACLSGKTGRHLALFLHYSTWQNNLESRALSFPRSKEGKVPQDWQTSAGSTRPFTGAKVDGFPSCTMVQSSPPCCMHMARHFLEPIVPARATISFRQESTTYCAWLESTWLPAYCRGTNRICPGDTRAAACALFCETPCLFSAS